MKKDPWHRNRLIRDGILRAILERMSVDDSVMVIGEGAEMKCRFDCPDLLKMFPERILTLPISEDANTNFAVGLALAGCKPIVDVISSDFLYRTMDSICNTVRATNAVHNIPKTIIIRAEFLTGGPTTGQRIESLFTHIPGLRVVVPSNPRDAYTLMAEALEYKGATVFFEDRMIEDATTPEYQKIGGFLSSAKFSRPMLRSELTVVSYGIMARAFVLRPLNPPPLDFFDLRTLYPLDLAGPIESVRRTGRLLVIEPDVTFGGIGAEVVAQVVERVPGCRVKRLGASRATIPACRDLHERMLPTMDQVWDAIRELTQ